MRPQMNYATRRGGAVTPAVNNWSRNHNTVRHEARELGPVSYVFVVFLLVLILGLIYVSQGTRATNYDYELSRMEDEIAELEAKKEDLAVEKARLTSIANAENNNTVANNMEDATVGGYAE